MKEKIVIFYSPCADFGRVTNYPLRQEFFKNIDRLKEIYDIELDTAISNLLQKKYDLIAVCTHEYDGLIGNAVKTSINKEAKIIDYLSSPLDLDAILTEIISHRKEGKN